MWYLISIPSPDASSISRESVLNRWGCAMNVPLTVGAPASVGGPITGEIIAVGPRGERNIPVKDFFLSVFTTALEHGEILTEIRIPIPRGGSGGAYFKLERKVGDFATVGVAAQVTVDAAGICQEAGIGLTNVGATPIKANRAEDFLRGKRLDESDIKQAAQLAAEAAQPSSDLRGPAEYKVSMVKELTKRALTRARERAAAQPVR